MNDKNKYPRCPAPGKMIQRDSRSQAAVEFALALPIFLTVVFGIIDFSILMGAWLTIQNITRQTIRYAITNQYDPTFCADGADVGGEACGGANEEEEILAARMDSIHAVGDGYRIGLVYDETIAWNNAKATAVTMPSYIKMTLCSSRDGRVPNLPRTGGMTLADYADCTISGVTNEDAGLPGDSVTVMLDYNHPFLTPFINVAWEYFHLSSQRSATVERFRVSRVLELPPQPNLNTVTPSNTPTASSTVTLTPSDTPSNTPTPTNTPQPLVVQWVIPATPGQIITDINQTNFESLAYDPDVCPGGLPDDDYGEKCNIQSVEMQLHRSNGGTSYTSIDSQTESTRGYCFFSGDLPCNNVSADPSTFSKLTPGTYRLRARAWRPDGIRSAWVVTTFIIPATLATATPTATPRPLVIEWVHPSVDGQIIYTNATTNFEAIAYDPNVCPGGLPATPLTDKCNISRIFFYLEAPSGGVIRNYQSDSARKYCVFGGSCNLMFSSNTNFNNNREAGYYTLRAYAVSDDGVTSEEITTHFRFDIALPTNTFTPTITPTPSRTLTPSRTPTRTQTLTPSITLTPSRTLTPSVTPTRTNTPTRTDTPTRTNTPTRTYTPSITPTFTPSRTRTPSLTPSNTPVTQTKTPTPTRSLTPSPTRTPFQE